MKKTIFRCIKKPLIRELFFYILFTSALAAFPYAQKLLFDVGIESGLRLVIWISVFYFCLIILHAITLYLSGCCEWDVGKSFTTCMRSSIFRAFYLLKPVRYRETTLGEKITVMDESVSEIESDYLEAVVDILKSALSIVIYLIMLFIFVDYRISIAIVAASLISSFLPKLTSEKLGRLRKEYLDETKSYMNRLTDFFSGHTGLDSVSRDHIINEHEKASEREQIAKIRFGHYKIYKNAVNQAVTNLVGLAAFVIVGILLLRGEISVGTGVATFSYVESFLYPINFILDDINYLNSAKEVMSETERIIFNPEIENETESTGQRESVFDITAKDVVVSQGDFRSGRMNAVFERGKKYAIIGENGSGKSSFFRSLYGDLEVEEGQILMNGEDVTSECSRVSDDYFSIIPQSAHIFDAGYIDNVTNFGAYTAEKLDCIEALFPKSIIEQLHQVKTCNDLSGGEQQILLLIKAILSGKEVFLLDEAFSAIDEQNTRIAKRAVDQIGDRGILIEITHDRSAENMARFNKVYRIGEEE